MTKKIILLIILADVLIMGLVFSVSGFYNGSVDTEEYVGQIRYQGGEDEVLSEAVKMRLFKPMYGVIGGALLPIMEPETAILLLNISFFIGLSVAFFFFLKFLQFGEVASFVGTLWLISGYPLLKYGLALGTDISGWFFAVFTAVLGLAGLKTGKFWPLVLSSVAGFIGFLGKETGILGLGFVGLSVLFSWDRNKAGLFFKRLVAISLPFVLLEGIYMMYLFSNGIPTFFDWYRIDGEDTKIFQTIPYFSGIEVAAFHILFLFASVGVFFAARSKEFFTKKWLATFLPLLIVSLPVILWPIYTTRILYIQFLFIIPMALYGADKFLLRINSESRRRMTAIFIVALPVVISVTLFLIARGRSLFILFNLV